MKTPRPTAGERSEPLSCVRREKRLRSAVLYSGRVRAEPKASPSETFPPSPLGLGLGRGEGGEGHGRRGESRFVFRLNFFMKQGRRG